MDPMNSDDREQRINITAIFDDEQVNPLKKARTRSNEVVKKLSFQLGCQSQDDDTNVRKVIPQQVNDDVEKKGNGRIPIINTSMKIIETANHVDRKPVSAPATPTLRHHYNKNLMVIHDNIQHEKDELEIENDMIYNSLRSRRRYQLWRGNNVFLCYGRLMLGVHIGHLTLSVSLITGTA